jgi:hypothetical protein
MLTPATGVIPSLVKVMGRLTCAHGLPVAVPRSTIGCPKILVVVGGVEVVGSTVVVVGSIAVVLVVGA